MLNDPIVDEVRQARQLHAAKFNFDLEAICQDLKRQEAASDLKLVAFPPKKRRQTRSGRGKKQVTTILPVEPVFV